MKMKLIIFIFFVFGSPELMSQIVNVNIEPTVYKCQNPTINETEVKSLDTTVYKVFNPNFQIDLNTNSSVETTLKSFNFTVYPVETNDKKKNK
jgi:hypothetical protein